MKRRADNQPPIPPQAGLETRRLEMKEREMKRVILGMITFLVFSSLFSAREAKANSFGYRMSITVNSSQVQNGPQTNFPFLFSSTSAKLKTTGNGGHVTNANGYDIIFRATDATTCGGTAPCTLNHEIEKYVATTGEFVAWVKVPSINTGTVIYVYYGNSSVTTSQENKTGVWDANYLAVYHFPNGTSLTVNDSSSHAKNLTNESNSVTADSSGKIDGGAVFNGTSSYADSGSAILSGNSQFTVSEWVKTSTDFSSAGGAETFGQFGGYSAAAFDMWIRGTNTMSVYVYPPGSSTSADDVIRYSSNVVNDGSWHYWTGVYNGGGAGSLDMYRDGALNNGSLYGSIPGSIQSSSERVMVGAYDGGGPGGYFTGSLDEIRISDIARSADWIKTEYNNQSAPSSFYALGSELSSPPTLITLAAFNVYPEGAHARIEWQTKSEVDNLGFDLYRVNPDGTGSAKLNSALIPGLISSAVGKEYAYVDTGINTGTPVCYMLEDIDLQGGSTSHGPACISQPAPQGQTGTEPADGTSLQDTTGEGSFGTGAGSSYTTGSAASQVSQGTLPRSTGSVTAVKLQSLKAQQGPEGVLIEWQTGYEVQNLGFHVYRDEGGRRVRLNKEMLAGSALLAGTHTVMRAGNTYSWFDPSGGKYWVEDVDLSGKKTLHGPIVPVPAAGPLPKKKILFLSQLRSEPVVTTLPFKVLRMLTGAHAAFPGGSSPLEIQWALAGSATMKVLIRQEGWYRLSFAQLARAGFDARYPRYIQLYADGKEHPILVTSTGIEFYATGVDTPWTDTRSYWLVNGLRPGKRIDQASGGTGHAGPTSFPCMVEEKPRSFYFPALLNGEASNWFGPLITENETDVTLTVSHRADGEASLEVLLQGATDQDHNVSVFLNGSSLGSVVFDGQTRGHALFSVARSQLIEGINQVRFISSGGEDISLVDTIRLTYQHTYTADGDHVRFTAAGGTTLILAGFTQPVRIIDITDPSAPQEVSGYIQRGGGVQLRVPGKGTRTLLAVTEGAMQAPQLLANTPSTWHANHRADLVIITHGDFTASLAPLTHLRQSQGLSVAVVDIEDLYDEFSYGEKTPYAVKAFLSAAKSWRRPPRYVLLMGNATYDPRNYTGSGDFDFVPTKLVDTAMIETASDDWFVDTDGLPDIPIGRIPVVSAQEAAQAVAKLINYEQGAPSTRALYVADIGDATDDFEGAISHMESLTSLIPDELFRSKLQDQTGPTLVTELAKGAGLVVYLGHGSVQLWDGNVLDTTSAEALTNATFPFFIALTCLNGYFIIPAADSLATTLMTDSAGGAVGVIASSSLTEVAPQEELGAALLSHLFTGATVGEALVQAKRAVSDPDVRKSYLLFGDPSMRVRR